MKKKQRKEIDRTDREEQPPPFLCKDRQCYGPMMTRIYWAEASRKPDDHLEFEDMRENLPIKKKVPVEPSER